MLVRLSTSSRQGQKIGAGFDVRMLFGIDQQHVGHIAQQCNVSEVLLHIERQVFIEGCVDGWVPAVPNRYV